MRKLIALLLALVFQCGNTGPDLVVVGFDVDDTVLFSSPAFEGNVKDGVFNWQAINTSDSKSVAIEQVVNLVRSYPAARVYFITARPRTEGETLSRRVAEVTGVPAEHVFFSTKKADLIRALRISVFYGDSDGDIRDAREGGATGVRITRSPLSSYKKNYNPGSFGEAVLDIGYGQ